MHFFCSDWTSSTPRSCVDHRSVAVGTATPQPEPAHSPNCGTQADVRTHKLKRFHNAVRTLQADGTHKFTHGLSSISMRRAQWDQTTARRWHAHCTAGKAATAGLPAPLPVPPKPRKAYAARPPKSPIDANVCSTMSARSRPSRSARRGRLSARGRSPRGQPAGSPPARRPPCWGFCQTGLQCCRARAYRVYIYTSPTRRRPSRRVLSTTRARGRHGRGADAARAARTSRCLPPCCQSAAPRRSCAKPWHYIIGGII